MPEQTYGWAMTEEIFTHGDIRLSVRTTSPFGSSGEGQNSWFLYTCSVYKQEVIQYRFKSKWNEFTPRKMVKVVTLQILRPSLLYCYFGYSANPTYKNNNLTALKQFLTGVGVVVGVTMPPPQWVVSISILPFLQLWGNFVKCSILYKPTKLSWAMFVLSWDHMAQYDLPTTIYSILNHVCPQLGSHGSVRSPHHHLLYLEPCLSTAGITWLSAISPPPSTLSWTMFVHSWDHMAQCDLPATIYSILNHVCPQLGSHGSVRSPHHQLLYLEPCLSTAGITWLSTISPPPSTLSWTMFVHSWDHMAQYDLPATIYSILNHVCPQLGSHGSVRSPRHHLLYLEPCLSTAGITWLSAISQPPSTLSWTMFVHSWDHMAQCDLPATIYSTLNHVCPQLGSHGSVRSPCHRLLYLEPCLSTAGITWLSTISPLPSTTFSTRRATNNSTTSATPRELPLGLPDSVKTRNSHLASNISWLWLQLGEWVTWPLRLSSFFCLSQKRSKWASYFYNYFALHFFHVFNDILL